MAHAPNMDPSQLDSLDRRRFFAGLGAVAVGTATIAGFNRSGHAAWNADPATSGPRGEGGVRGGDGRDDDPKTGLPDDYPRQAAARVQRFVRVSHGDYNAVKEMVTEQPALARCSWDWGFGDWESALGAASHVGSRDIAQLLMEHGARANIFTFAMLGDLKAVQSIVEASPGIQRTLGPHGITLLRHAEMGREKASAVRDYLTELGDANPQRSNIPVWDEDRNRLVGKYTIENTETVIEVAARRNSITLDFGAGPRGVRKASELNFYPAGVEGVDITFEVENNRATMLRIIDGPTVIRALRSL